MPRTVFSRQLVLSTPAYVSADLLAGVHDELAGYLRTIEYAAVNVVHTGFRRTDIAHPLPSRTGTMGGQAPWRGRVASRT